MPNLKQYLPGVSCRQQCLAATSATRQFSQFGSLGSWHPQPAPGTRHPAPGAIGTLAAAKSQLIHQITTRRKHEHTMV